MSERLDARRRRTIVYIAAAALVATLAALIAHWPKPAPEARREVGEPVAPQLAGELGTVSAIRVTTKYETYTLARSASGWTMPERGDYPARSDRIEQLARSLSTMVFARPMTRDDRKFDRIGLGDPRGGGQGALVELRDGEGRTLFSRLVGYRSGRWYVREPDDLQAWAVDQADLPPLQRAALWLDLSIPGLRSQTPVAATVEIGGAPPYALRRADDGSWTLGPPFDRYRVSAPFALGVAAEALVSYAAVDVAPAGAHANATLVAAHTTRMESGLVVRAELRRVGRAGWLTLTASGEGEAEPLADAINARAARWTYALGDSDFEAFTTPLNVLATPMTGPR